MDVAENLSLVAQLLIDRTKALVAIQELHRSWNNSDSADEELVCVTIADRQIGTSGSMYRTPARLAGWLTKH